VTTGLWKKKGRPLLKRFVLVCEREGECTERGGGERGSNVKNGIFLEKTAARREKKK